LHLIVDGGERRQHDDRKRGVILPQGLGNLPAGQLWHHHIEERQVGLGRRLERRTSIGDLDHLVPLAQQKLAQKEPTRLVILRDQELCH
jgi:hypothetical protein